MIETTLNNIRTHSPCTSGWEKLLRHLNKTKADDEPLSLLTVLESNGLDDALWCLRTVKGYDKQIRLLAVASARRVQHLMTDQRSIAAIDTAERYANGLATDEELKAAADDADDAAWDAARAAAMAAAWAAARDAAMAAAWDAARDAVSDAADAAAMAAAWAAARDAADAARAAAWNAADDAAMAARAAEVADQTQLFIEMCNSVGETK